MDRANKKRPYAELQITGPPLYNQGVVPEDQHYCKIKCPLIDARRTAVVVVDVQPEYWSECPAVQKDFPHFPSRISSLVQHCRSQRAKMIWVRADYSYERSPWLTQFTRLHKGKIPPIVKPSSKWEEFAEPLDDEFQMTKTSWSSTSSTQLLNVLRESGIDTVLVCGLITSVCVQHSAFGIFEAGFRTILVTDACADRGKARHDAALALYGDYMYELRTVDSVRAELRNCSVKFCDMVHKSILKPSETMSTKSDSTGSLSTLDGASTDDEDLQENMPGKENEYAIAF